MNPPSVPLDIVNPQMFPCSWAMVPEKGWPSDEDPLMFKPEMVTVRVPKLPLGSSIVPPQVPAKAAGPSPPPPQPAASGQE